MSKKEIRNRNITIAVFLIAIVIINIIFLVGSTNYRILRVRSHINFDVKNSGDYVLKEVFVGYKVKDPNDEDVIWYYEKVAGAYNFDDFENKDNLTDSKEDFITEFYQRVLLELDIDEVYVCFIFANETNRGDELFIKSDKIDLYRSTDIEINLVNIKKEDVDYKTKELNFYLEALFNLV